MTANHNLTLVGLYLAEVLNWFVHATNYSIANPMGTSEFIVDIWGLPAYAWVENLTVGMLLNWVLALAAILVPVAFWSLFLEKQDLVNNTRELMGKNSQKIIMFFIGGLYALVIATEFAALGLRIIAETNVGPIPTMGDASSGVPAMLIMSIALVGANCGLGLYIASIHLKISALGNR